MKRNTSHMKIGWTKMSEVKKKFDKALYDVADKAAKDAMVTWLKQNDHNNIDTNETTYFDIVSTVSPDLPRHLYEVEVKYSWKTPWPDSWAEIRIPYRKKRLLDKWKKECDNDLLTFVVFRNDCTQAWFIDGDTVLNSEVKEASNRNIRKGEQFFHIPTADAYLVDMKNESSSGHRD